MYVSPPGLWEGNYDVVHYREALEVLERGDQAGDLEGLRGVVVVEASRGDQEAATALVRADERGPFESGEPRWREGSLEELLGMPASAAEIRE